ncbi:hypothetical protein [Homoserinibacter gongjuensis]|uniref:hypothetical protein n=1 Tax=Homoserinibacter gongjuensis TaxID=1162968 RepID=UPI0024E0E1B8|nr:hypothetical protein [Homoserinibacter gongjuensis]
MAVAGRSTWQVFLTPPHPEYADLTSAAGTPHSSSPGATNARFVLAAAAASTSPTITGSSARRSSSRSAGSGVVTQTSPTPGAYG